ncbi:MAG TPA: efflux RND transporter periplasmic adaptor subunit [Hyphomicrobiaceae bacterium]|jgi:cobalt-zinc-cadmium efflux system membrane fusion protein
MTQFDSHDRDDMPSKRQQRHVLLRSLPSPKLTFPTILFLVVVGAWLVLFVSSALRGSTRAQPPLTRERVQVLSKAGGRIKVPPESPLRSKIVIAEVGAKEVQRKLVLPAVVEVNPARSVRVLPPLAGRIADLNVRLGSRVTEGQVLAVIDSGDLAQAYSDAAKARSVLDLTKQALDRSLALEPTRAISVKDREQAQSDYAQAQAEFKRAESRLKAIGVSTDQQEQSRLLPVKSPISGSVTDLQVGLGAYLNDATAAIMTIADLGTVWVTAGVPEKDTALVVKGQSVEVVFTAYPDTVFKGQVLFVSDVLDPDIRRTKVRIAFQNPDVRLKPNMFASATFFAPRQMLPVIPTAALLLREEVDQVLVEIEPWVFEPRRVETGYQEGDQAAITQGLKPGERIVVRGGVLLND